MHRYHKIVGKELVLFLFFLCWMVYFTSYLGRLNYSAAMPLMIKEAVLSKSQAGFISMLYFALYGVGQLCNGILGDRIDPKKMIFAGLFLSTLANLTMGIFHSFFLCSLIWGINGYAQAMIWPPILRIFSESLQEKEKLKACVNIVSSQVAGTFAAYLMSSGLIRFCGWSSVFFAAAFFLLAVSVFWILGFQIVERKSEILYRKKKAEEETKGGLQADRALKNPPPTSRPIEKKRLLDFSFIVRYGLAVALIPTMVQGVLKDGLTTWIPTYITETFFTSPAFSVLLTTCIPMVNLMGAYCANYIYKKNKNNEFSAAFYLFGLASLSLVGIYILRGRCLFLTVFLFSITTLSMMGVNTLFINILPMKFERINKVSTISGFFNSVAYAGCALSAYGIGVFVEKIGWSFAVASWLLLTLLALFVCFYCRKKDLSEKMRA